MAPGFFFILTKIFASMLRFIALTVLAYFIFKWLDRFFGGGRPSGPAKSSSKKKGSTFSKNVGEYVDYEEVKDDQENNDGLGWQIRSSKR